MAMANNTDMEESIQLLFREGDSKEVRTAIETLLKIFRNITQNPEDHKFKCLKLSNTTFFKTIWRYKGARLFLLNAGWKIKSSEVIFEDSSKLDNALKILLSKRFISPEHDEWSGAVIQGPSKQQLRELDLREKAIIERDKELAEFFKNREERKKISEWVKAEHIADRKRLQLLKPNVNAEHIADRERLEVLKPNVNAEHIADRERLEPLKPNVKAEHIADRRRLEPLKPNVPCTEERPEECRISSEGT